MSEVPLIRRVQRSSSVDYEVCREGLTVLRQLRPRQLRILLNVTSQRQSLAPFSNSLLQLPSPPSTQRDPTVCLTITSKWKDLPQPGGHALIALSAYEDSEKPMMVLLGYLAASAILYHHSGDLSETSALTQVLFGLRKQLVDTNVLQLNREIKFRKGYTRTPYFLCLMDEGHKSQEDAFREFYRYRESKEQFNQVVDLLIDYFPQRASTTIGRGNVAANTIGRDFEESLLGRELFNYEFTGVALQNLCFECCQKFNHSQTLNLPILYEKIIENQKARLQDEAYEQYLNSVQINLPAASLPVSASYLLLTLQRLAEESHSQALQLAANCMNLQEYQVLRRSLAMRIAEHEKQTIQKNSQKAKQLCEECLQMLEGQQECDGSLESIVQLFKQSNNKLQLYHSQCSQILKNDSVLTSFADNWWKLQDTIISHLESICEESLSSERLSNQQDKVYIQDLRYRLRISENTVKHLEYEYALQGDILSQYKQKLINEPEPSPIEDIYNSEQNKLRKRVQQLQQEAKDQVLKAEELESILERYEGIKEKDTNKLKFSKEINEMIREVGRKVNEYYAIIKEAKNTAQIYDKLKQQLSIEKKAIADEGRKQKQQIARKQSELQKLIKEKNLLQQAISQARSAIQVHVQTAEKNKQSIDTLQNNYTNINCCLAELQNELQLHKKALGLLGEQAQKGRSEQLVKFCKVLQPSELKQLLMPLIRK